MKEHGRMTLPPQRAMDPDAVIRERVDCALGETDEGESSDEEE